MKKVKKILIRLQNHSLFFSYKRNQLVREDLMNTNIISDSELVFSDDYMQANEKIVMPFFRELCEMHQITTLVYQNKELATFSLRFFKGIKEVRIVKIKKEENVSYTLCEQLISMKQIQLLDCYSIPNFMLELLDKHQIKVLTHSEVFYISPFMQRNGLTDYSKLFYQKKIRISPPFSDEDKADFQSFLRINHYLKVIEFQTFHRENLEFVLEQLQKNRFKHIYIELYEDITDPKDILYLKELNKQYKKRDIQIELFYSDEYLSNNLIKQISLNTLKICGFILLTLVFSSFGYVFVRNYLSMQEVSSIQSVVQETIQKSEQIVEEDPPTESNLVIKNKYIASLKTINPDVVGYLKVKNTNVDYPVVLGKDNVYYLKKNLYQEDDINGWIYMDFRNSAESLNDNTIIYGHNMYYSGVMFGTLHRVLTSNWQSDPNNLVISFDTMYESMNWQIFSIYTIPKTSDYLKVSFDSPSEQEEYIQKVQSRSIKNFGVSVTGKDKMLTLSTCTGDNSRLVIHAKLLEMEA